MFLFRLVFKGSESATKWLTTGIQGDISKHSWVFSLRCLIPWTKVLTVHHPDNSVEWNMGSASWFTAGKADNRGWWVSRPGSPSYMCSPSPTAPLSKQILSQTTGQWGNIRSKLPHTRPCRIHHRVLKSKDILPAPWGSRWSGVSGRQ